MIPGEVLPAAGMLTLNEGAPAITLMVANTGDRPVQVGSHYHFAETNPALTFDRATAHGHRLDIASGTAVRPGLQEANGGEAVVEKLAQRKARVMEGELHV